MLPISANNKFSDQQGFIFISSASDDAKENLPSTRSGLSNLYRLATNTSRLLVVSRLSNERVLPWMVSSTGAIRCYDTVSLSQKLSLHRHTKVPILLHVLLWDRALSTTTNSSIVESTKSTSLSSSSLSSLPPQIQFTHHSNENKIQPLSREGSDQGNNISNSSQLGRETVGDLSFRFQDFSL